jgi:predicted PurR-regulated permease PerM
VVVLSVGLFIVLPVMFGLGFGILQGIDFARGLAQDTTAVIQSVKHPEDPELKQAVGEGAWLTIRDTLVGLQSRDEAERVEILGIDGERLTQGITIAGAWLRDNAERIASTALDTGRGALTVAVSTVGSLGLFLFAAFLTTFFFFFVSMSYPSILELGRSLLPDQDREKAVDIIKRMDRAVNGFIRGRVTIAFVQGVFYTIGFWLIGVPAPLIFGPAVAFITLVPYAGLLAVPVVMVMLWLQGLEGFRGEIWWVVLAPFGLYQIGQVLDDYVLTPIIQGKSTDLSTPTILFASIAGGMLLGFFGLLVAIPLAACAKILFDQIFWPRFKAWTQGREKDFLPVDRD